LQKISAGHKSLVVGGKHCEALRVAQGGPRQRLGIAYLSEVSESMTRGTLEWGATGGRSMIFAYS
jgi:hypothetical protein